MVLMASGNTKPRIPEMKVTPFKHWFNKNQNRLLEEYTGNPDKFMDWAKKEFDK